MSRHVPFLPACSAEYLDSRSQGKATEQVEPEPSSAAALGGTPGASPFLSSSTSPLNAHSLLPFHPPISNLSTSSPYRKCGICLEPCRPVSNPYKSATGAASSSQVPFGIQLRCGHSYCVQDATTYIASRLDDDNGSLMKVFPIQCPEVCTRVEDRDERDLS